jgi:hypothetical protein
VQAEILGAYKRMLLAQFASTVALAVVLFVTLMISFKSGQESPPLIPLIIGAGMLGALFSALMRLYHVDQAGVALITPTVRDLGNMYIVMYSLVPPIIGAIAAVVLYLVFVAKFLSGGLFPEIACLKEGGCKNILEVMRNYWPHNPEDYGKTMVWSFLAGFSERLVPDILQSLVARSTKPDDA